MIAEIPSNLWRELAQIEARMTQIENRVRARREHRSTVILRVLRLRIHLDGDVVRLLRPSTAKCGKHQT